MSILGWVLACVFGLNNVTEDLGQHIHAPHVVDLPLLRIAVEGSDNPIYLEKPCQALFHLISRDTTLSGDIQMSCMLFEVYRCVQLNRCSVVCGCVLQRGQRGLDRCG